MMRSHSQSIQENIEGNGRIVLIVTPIQVIGRLLVVPIAMNMTKRVWIASIEVEQTIPTSALLVINVIPEVMLIENYEN
jgi:hypothetical protein